MLLTMPVLFIAVVFFGLASGNHTVSGKQHALCDALGGTYTPEAQQAATPPQSAPLCPGGSWANVIHRPQPTK